MAFITREDGVHFVVPSYRDSLTMRSASGFKKELISLSGNYGEYITLQKKSPVLFEVAFSPDAGYLLGESIWHYFKRPMDMIYCEAVPNTKEAILVIVQSGTVYLDGRFQLDSIPDELVVFLTQKNNFDIYTYGDVPISKVPEDGKFSFEESSVHSFTELENPVFASLPLVQSYQLRLVATVLKEHKIGVLPARQITVIVIVVGMLWMMYEWMSAPPPEQEQAKHVVVIQKTSPYADFYLALQSPAPDEEIATLLKTIYRLYGLLGWTFTDTKYEKGLFTASVQSGGSDVSVLSDWAERNGAQVTLAEKGFALTFPIKLANREVQDNIYPLQDVVIKLIDRLATVYPGNHIRVGRFVKKGVYSFSQIDISIDHLAPVAIGLVGETLQGLPLVTKTVTLKADNEGLLSGTITLQAMGN